MKAFLIGGGVGFVVGAVLMFIYYKVVSAKATAAEAVIAAVKKDV